MSSSRVATFNERMLTRSPDTTVVMSLSMPIRSHASIMTGTGNARWLVPPQLTSTNRSAESAPMFFAVRSMYP